MIVGSTTGIALAILVPVAIAGLIALVNALLAQVSAATSRRRESYASAVRTLVSWIEFPFRIRRRVDDEPETLAGLAERGHAIQEQLEYNRAWIVTESSRVASVYAAVLDQVNAVVGPAAREAWMSGPASVPSDMVLGPVMDRDRCMAALVELEAAIGRRFGWGRFWPWHGAP